MKSRTLPVTLIAFVVVSLSIIEQARSQNRGRSSGDDRVLNGQLVPNWFNDARHLWYRKQTGQRRFEYVLVDVERGAKQAAFDHEKLADALKEAGQSGTDARRLELDELRLSNDLKSITFRSGDQDWQCLLDSYELKQLDERPRSSEADRYLPNLTEVRRSVSGGDEAEITFDNRTEVRVEYFWVDPQGERQRYGALEPGEDHTQHTYAGHYWEILNAEGERVAAFRADRSGRPAVIGEANPPREGDARPAGRTDRRRGGRTRRPTTPTSANPLRSADGSLEAFVRDGNVFVRDATGENERQISHDGGDGSGYGMLQWAPQTNCLIGFQIEPGDVGDVYLIESSPDGGGRAQLSTRSYALPGDKFTTYTPGVLTADGERMKPIDVDPIDFGRPRIRWAEDGKKFLYEKVDRGHQRYRLIEVDVASGQSRTIIDEQTESFIWTNHYGSRSVPMVTWLQQTDELIYRSEKDGWRHLYLIDRDQETPQWVPITRGEFVVRSIEEVDEEKRQIWFTASGYYPDQDPYLIHYFRVDFDGDNLTALTDGNGTHTVQFSPDRSTLIATHSRVDQPPIHELRRTDDGRLICHLETADITDLQAQGWQPPEVFVAKGRDGETDIWGIICRPADFDPKRKYPVIEDIYAGPHDSHVPKQFSARSFYESLTRLGFIVVKIDGMGTANRSKAFHDVCWHNLKDAGLPDRIAWHKAVHEEYDYYDIDRVGIYGTSAGGQNSTGALLFHPEFYKVAVSACGCHDNRMDKASWNEQWMGYPVGPHYAASSNIDNAHRLQGKLLLIVGELDTNVPPESTMRLVDALIKADKDFDLLVVPGGGHGMGGAYGRRRMHDFFVRHLLGEEPPDRNRSND